MAFGDELAQKLQPIVDWFASFNTPEPIVHWGHPVMMGIVAFVMGGAVALAGWKVRTSTDEEVVDKNRQLHRKTAPFMTMFIAMGYTGGVLSLVMQGKPILESPHFITGTLVVALLMANGAISFFGIKKGVEGARNVHAYLGSGIMVLLVIHAALGLKLGLSI
ncbi:MAG: hypothetical protein B0A82_25615 [Alkalinema sp. CACIAM 70d]|nr:MAG: hypothetical protein B0A82_25615 [Alkalinema sp. CACIAM 70d]